MRRLLSLLLAAVLLLLPACADPEADEGLLLYFPTDSYFEGSALGSQPVTLPEGQAPEAALLRALLAGPTQEGLRSPFPAGVTLRSWHISDGILLVNLSEQYGGLSGISLTLADYSITLTLCQLEHIDGVSITVENDPIPFRYRQTLTAADLIADARPGG